MLMHNIADLALVCGRHQGMRIKIFYQGMRIFYQGMRIKIFYQDTRSKA